MQIMYIIHGKDGIFIWTIVQHQQTKMYRYAIGFKTYNHRSIDVYIRKIYISDFPSGLYIYIYIYIYTVLPHFWPWRNQTFHSLFYSQYYKYLCGYWCMVLYLFGPMVNKRYLLKSCVTDALITCSFSTSSAAPYRYLCSKVNIWKANCARATAFIFDPRMDALVKVSKL